MYGIRMSVVTSDGKPIEEKIVGFVLSLIAVYITAGLFEDKDD